MRATPDKNSIPIKDGQPDTVELIPGPECECGECPPRTIYGFGTVIDADYMRKVAAQVEALHTLGLVAEVPSDFAEFMEQMAEEADDGHTHAVLETYTVCWN